MLLIMSGLNQNTKIHTAALVKHSIKVESAGWVRLKSVPTLCVISLPVLNGKFIEH